MILKSIQSKLLLHKKDIIAVTLLTIFVYLSVMAIFHDGFFRTIDDITTVRIQYMVKELQRGEWLNNFPVRFSAELAHHYGYPVYLFYSPLTYYAGAFLMIVGNLNHILATKAVYAFPLIIGPYLFYFAARQKLSPLPALVASAFFTLFPFRGFDTYIRGGVGEAWAIAFLPGVFAGIFMLGKNSRAGGLIFSVFLFLCMISHNLSGLLIVGLVVLYGVLFELKRSRYWKYFIFGLALSAFFWLPSFYYLPIVKVSYSSQNTGQILDFLLPVSKLLDVNYSVYGEQKYQAILFYIIGLSLIISFIRFKGTLVKNKTLLFWGGLSILFYLSLSNLFTPLWKVTLPITRILQFPWRIFILLTFIQPFFIGLFVESIKKTSVRVVLSVVLIATTLLFVSNFKPKEYSYYYEYTAFDSGVCGVTWGDEYLPIWVKDCHGFSRPEKDLLSEKDVQIQETFNNKLRIEATVTTTKPTDVLIEKYYYPWWEVRVDGKKVQPDYTFSRWGTMKIQVPSGKHTVTVSVIKTPVMWIGDIISLISFGVLLLLTFQTIKKSRNKTTSLPSKKK